MTQLYREDGAVVPATAVLAEPNLITQIRNLEKDKYSAIQVGFGQAKKVKKPIAGHLKGLALVKSMREFRVKPEEIGDLKRGDTITVNVFIPGDIIKVTGNSKGKGFQGVVKRHGFHGSPATHGHKDQERMPGSIGATTAQRVIKGKRMAGHMGDEQVTVTNLEIVSVDAEKNILYVKGAVPGARNGLLLIVGPGTMDLAKPEAQNPEPKLENAETPEEVKVEEAKITEPAEQPAVEVTSEEAVS